MTKKYIKNIVLFLVLILSQSLVFAQERIPMKLEISGIYTIPCEVNGLKLNFVFDTGASVVHISLIEAAFMLKNGYINEDDFIGTGNYILADGSIAENALINLKSIKIGNATIKDITACVSSNINASLLLGQSAIKKLGKYAIDGNYLILYNSRGESHSENTVLDNQYQLWLTLSDEYETGTFEEFRVYLSNPDHRWQLYNEIVEEYDLPDYATFSEQIGYYISESDIALRTLYDTLKRDNYSVPDEYNTFEQILRNDINAQRELYEQLKDDNYDVPEDYGSYERTLFPNNDVNTQDLYNNRQQDNITYYIAQASSQVNLREGPGANYKIISKIPKGSYVLLSSDDKGQSYRKVLHIDKNIYGYVSNKYLINFNKLREDASGNLQPVSRTYKNTADIIIKNNTSKNATINVGDNSYKFKPHETKTITNIKPGKFKIMASAPGVIPYVAIDNVEAGYEYSWEFYITTIRH